MASIPATTSTHIGEILAPLQVIQALDKTTDHAKDQGDLNLYDNTIHEWQEHGISYQIRLCPALHKNESAAPDIADIQKGDETSVQYDPFTPPFTSLYIGEMKDALEEEEGGYYVLLNKFAVVRGHFLMVTKDYQPQSDPLSPSQLTQIYLLLLSAQSENKPYFAFFNCGSLSGASQPHKHIQFMPGESPIEKLAKGKKVENETRPFTIPSLPFGAHIRRLDSSIISSASSLASQSTYAQEQHTLDQVSTELSMAFMSLLDEMYHSMRIESSQANNNSTYSPAYTKWGKTGDAKKVEPSIPSYNVVMTLNHMYLFPRVAERFTMEKDPALSTSIIDPSPPLPASPSDPPSTSTNPAPTQPVDPEEEPYLSLSVNSLGFAGMLLVKSEDELERVKKVGVGKILSGVGRKPLNVILGGKEDRGHDDVFAELA